MLTRNHFETFVSLRNKASKYRSFTKYDDDERLTLVNNTETHFIDSDSTETPYWVSYVNEFSFESNKINNKITELEKVQRNSIKLKNKEIFDDLSNGEKQTEVDIRCQEISRHFNRLYSLVNDLRNVRRGNGCEKRLISNILQWEYRMICDLSNKFREVQRQYINRMKEYDNCMIKFDDEQYLDSSPNIPDMGITNQLQLQKMNNTVIMDDQKFLQEREHDIKSICKSIEELNRIFQDINTTIISQDSLLDRIDYNVEHVEMAVQKGVLELAKAEKNVKSSRKMKLIFVMTLSLLLLLLFIILKS